MTRTSGTVLVFGESINDSASIHKLLIAANAALDGRVKALPRPISLNRHAKWPAVRNWVDELHRAIRGFEATGQSIAAVVVHRDADGHDPDGRIHTDLARQIAQTGGLPVVPVQEIEAWWFLFPQAVEAVRPRVWRGKLPRTARDVELIDRPKERLQQLTRTTGAPEYSEADSPAIAEKIRALRPARVGSSLSYDRLVATARGIR